MANPDALNEVLQGLLQQEIRHLTGGLVFAPNIMGDRYSFISPELRVGVPCVHPLPSAKNTLKSVSPSEEDCSICLEPLDKNVAETPCKHRFHFDCITPWLDESNPNGPNTDCPECRVQMTVMTGEQPEGGTFLVDIHEAEGKMWWCFIVTLMGPFRGMYGRKFFLPFNDEGRHIMGLLQVAFERRLLFRVRQGVLESNGFELKDATSGGASRNAYPDPSYFCRIKSVLRDVGIK